MRTNLISRLETESSPDMRKLLQREVTHLDKIVKRLSAKCVEQLEGDERTRNLSERLKEVRGVSDNPVVAILGGHAELERPSDKKLFKLCGIALFQKQSGNKEWIRKIWGGRSDVRSALYMGATACLL